MEKISSKSNPAVEAWQDKIKDINENPDYVISPRGMEVKEQIGGQITVPMPAYNDLHSRNINEPFMYSEAQAIIGGSNLLDDFKKYMGSYARYSDDGVFMRGSYGPKVVDQLGYVVDSIEADQDTRQAYMNIWRERPGPSKDIPCTTGMQFFVRPGEDEKKVLDMSVYMRSNDVVLGTTYDQFTFSMVAKSVQLLLRERGIDVDLGDLTLTAGSMHIYKQHYDKVDEWSQDTSRNLRIGERVDQLEEVETYQELVRTLGNLAYIASQQKEDHSY